MLEVGEAAAGLWSQVSSSLEALKTPHFTVVCRSPRYRLFLPDGFVVSSSAAGIAAVARAVDGWEGGGFSLVDRSFFLFLATQIK